MARKDARPGMKEARAERMLLAMELRKKGLRYHEIATELHVSESQAYQDVQERLADIRAKYPEAAEAVRTMELDRLDRWLTKLQPAVDEGDPRAIEVALKIQARRAAYLGLDEPAKHDVSVHEYVAEWADGTDAGERRRPE